MAPAMSPIWLRLKVTLCHIHQHSLAGPRWRGSAAVLADG